jgi:hypothetical protein
MLSSVAVDAGIGLNAPPLISGIDAANFLP